MADDSAKTISTDHLSLSAIMFDPLTSALKGRTRFLASPDGDLTRLPFEVLPTADNRQLIDDYQVSYVSTGRDVVRFGAATSGDSAESVVVADPDYDLNADRPALVLENGAEPNRSVGRLSQEMNRYGQVHFSALPGTALEGEEIAGILAVQEPLMGDAALKYTVRRVRSTTTSRSARFQETNRCGKPSATLSRRG